MFGGNVAGLNTKKKKRLEKAQGISDELSNSDAHLKQNDVLKKILNKIFAHNINEIEVFNIILMLLNYLHLTSVPNKNGNLRNYIILP